MRLTVQHDGKVLPEWQVLDRQGIALPPGAIDSTSSPVTIKARGMQDQRVELAREPTRVVNMEKCLMNIQATTQPPTAKVVGARVRPWGRFTVTATHSGYDPMSIPVEISAPESCTGVPAMHPIEFNLKRRIIVQAMDASGNGVTGVRVTIAGAPRDPLGFALDPAAYAYTAQHAELGTRKGSLTVEHCKSVDCKPQVLRVMFPERPGFAASLLGPNGLYLASGLLLLGSGIAGWDALAADRRLSEYTTKREEGEPVFSLVDRRNRSALNSDILLLTGGVTLLSGYLWSIWGDTD